MFLLNKSLFVFKTNNYLRTQSDLLHLYPRGQLEQAFPFVYIPVPVNYLETELIVLFEMKIHITIISCFSIVADKGLNVHISVVL